MKYKVQISNGWERLDYCRGLTEQEAIHICESHGRTLIDEDDNIWIMDYVEDDACED